jgi:hypothetical protein
MNARTIKRLAVCWLAGACNLHKGHAPLDLSYDTTIDGVADPGWETRDVDGTQDFTSNQGRAIISREGSPGPATERETQRQTARRTEPQGEGASGRGRRWSARTKAYNVKPTGPRKMATISAGATNRWEIPRSRASRYIHRPTNRSKAPA